MKSVLRAVSNRNGLLRVVSDRNGLFRVVSDRSCALLKSTQRQEQCVMSINALSRVLRAVSYINSVL